MARAAGADVVVGVGGGTTLDTAKAVGHQAGIAWATAPTVASTDAPTSALSVVYTDDGVFEEYIFFPHNPDLVLVDTQLCANAPYRFLVSGMGDALATWVRARATASAQSRRWPGAADHGRAGPGQAELGHLIDYGFLRPRRAALQHVVTPALEKVVGANTLLSGLGFEAAGWRPPRDPQRPDRARRDASLHAWGEGQLRHLTQFALGPADPRDTTSSCRSA